MTAISITPGYPNFSDTDGSALNDGYVYIGLEYQDPITAPTGAFWDEAFQIPADQPLRTSGGYIVRNGSPAAVYTGAAYSILVQNKNLVTVYNAPSAVITNVTNTVEEITQYQGAHATDPIARNDGTPLQVGDLYFNTVVNELKVWSGSTWVPASPGSVTVEDFTGTGAQTAFNLATAPVAENNTQIYIDGVYQQKDTYSLAGATVNFSTAPPINSGIEVVSFSIASLGTVDAANVSYNEGGTGAVNRSVQAKLQESVSVKDFGAVGDGVTDDTAAIQAAIDYAKTVVNASINYAITVTAVVHFPAGTYATSGITIYKGVILKGESAAVVQLKHTGTGLSSDIITTDVGTPTEKACVKGMWLKGNGVTNTRYGIRMDKCYYTNEVDDVVITDCQYGMYLTDCWTFQLKNSTLRGNSYGVYWDDANAAIISHCRIEYNTNYNLNSPASNSLRIESTAFQGAVDGDSVTLQNCNGTTIDTCDFEDNNRSDGGYADLNIQGSVVTIQGGFWAQTNTPPRSTGIAITANVGILSLDGVMITPGAVYNKGLVLTYNAAWGDTVLNATQLGAGGLDITAYEGAISYSAIGGTNVPSRHVFLGPKEWTKGGGIEVGNKDYSSAIIHPDTRSTLYDQEALLIIDPSLNTATSSDYTAQFNTITQTAKVQGVWNKAFYLGSYALWVDATGDLRINNGVPASDTDGTVVGTQS